MVLGTLLYSSHQRGKFSCFGISKKMYNIPERSESFQLGGGRLGEGQRVCVFMCMREKLMKQSAFWVSTMSSLEIIIYHYMCVFEFYHFLLQALGNNALCFSLPSMLRFSLDRHTDLDRIFNIHSGNGSLYTSKPLDRELSQWHNLTVIAAEISKMNFMYIIFSIFVVFYMKNNPFSLCT